MLLVRYRTPPVGGQGWADKMGHDEILAILKRNSQ